MAAGLATYAVEVEFTAGVWTALTSSCAGVTIEKGRDTPTGDWAPDRLTAVFYNAPDSAGIQHLTPDNPLSQYWPNVVPGKRIRATLTGHSIAAADQLRFLGWVDAFDADMGTGPAEAKVTVSASDGLAQVATRALMCDVTERSRADIALHALTVDLYPFDDPATSRTARNLGGVAGSLAAPHGPGQVWKPAGGGGSLKFVEPDDTLLVDGMMQVRPTSGGTAPVLALQRRPEELWLSIQMWVRIDTAPASGDYRTVLAAYDADDQLYYRVAVRNTAGVVTLDVDNGAGTTVLTLNNAANPYASPSLEGGSWWFFELWSITGSDMNSQFGNDAANAASGTATGLAISNTVSVVLGGQMNPKTPGKVIRAASVDIAAVIFNQATGYNRHNLAIPLDTSQSPSTASGRWNDLGAYSSNDTPTVGADLAIGSTSQLVARGTIRGSSLAEQMQLLARTIGGVCYWSANAGKLQLRLDSACRPAAPLVTITASADDDASSGASMLWASDVTTAPTRVTASSPAGQAVKVDTAREALGLRREATVETCAISADDAGVVAAWVLNQSSRLRLAILRVDLAGAANDLYAALLSLYPTATLRVAGLPAGMAGWTYVDGYVQGWRERYGPDEATWELDLSPAEPPEAFLDNAEYGRVSGSGTTLNGALTNSGTTVALTPPGGTTFSTAAGDYPADVLVDGERITLPSAPASGSAPSWTGCTRGVAPTTATAHSSGAAVDVWHAATVAI